MTATAQQNQIALDLCEFIAHSPTPFHATKNLLDLFTESGFQRLHEQENWQLVEEQRYVITKNDSSIIAFQTSGEQAVEGFKMLGAHTDSPCLRIKPLPEIYRAGVTQLGVEVYGGALYHPWLDRDLSIAGRVSGVNKDGDIISELVDFERAIAIIPNLAIHLERDANSKRTINAQRHLPLIIGADEDFNLKSELLKLCSTDMQEVFEFELSCYDVQQPALVGLNQEFISAARLDNLLSSYIGARALIDSDSDKASLFVSTDHEEVGSASACGAQGPFLRSVLERLCETPADFARMISQSMMISCDNAHALHPNYADKHDGNHQPIINQGPVIKINNNQRYATNSISSAKFQNICSKLDVPVQTFVTRSDMGCGSTIGPITASELGIETLDIGAPQWAMHSIRETAGVQDCAYLYQSTKAFLDS